MLLRNLMEDKQLDFNQPFLSVRRFSSTKEKYEKRKSKNSFPSIPPIPSYKSELKSGPMRNPGAVPFVWEQIPGKPKTENEPLKQAFEKPPIVPKLPPGRILKVSQQPPNKISKDPNVLESQARKAPSSLQNILHIDKNAMKFENSKDAMEEKESPDLVDDDDEYLDAVDTLSRTESFFINCSLSGLSGLDEPDRKPFGTFSADPQTRDFMMGRFLPAAKAMASETPPYASWKQPVAREQPKQVNKVAESVKRTPLSHHRPVNLLNYAKEYEEEDSDDSDSDDVDDSRNLLGKGCGLLPRFCLKSSFCLLNPVPGMSVRTRVPTSPSSRTRARSSSTGSSSEHESEQSRNASFEQRSIGGRSHSTELYEDRCILKNGSDQGIRKLEGSSLYKRLQGGVVSSDLNELPQAPLYEEKGYIGIPEEAQQDGANDVNLRKKGPSSFRELLACQSTEEEIGLSSPMVEKTLYVDSVHTVDSSNSNSRSLDTKEIPNIKGHNLESPAKIRGIEETKLLDSSFEDTEKLSFPDKSDQKAGMGILKGFEQGLDLYHECSISENSKIRDNGSLYFEDQQFQKVENVENSHASDSDLPLPPPLPKSPTESWLWRTLPSMSSKNPSSRSYLGTDFSPKNQDSNTASNDPKWQTIVKTTKGQNHHSRFSEELMTPIPETS